VRTIDIIQKKLPKALPLRPASQGADMAEELRGHLALCQEILGLVEREGQALRTAEPEALRQFTPARQGLLARLQGSLERLRQHRTNWQQRPAEERAGHPAVALLLRQNQDLIMKIVLLDRENEQTLLRRGLVPASQLPSANRQRPHFVAELYRRQGTAT
jgi:hypothetical protein